jgi:hypothetical protein
MTFGPGKYDDLATMVREAAGVGSKRGGGVIVIVVNGERGNGFSVQADLETSMMLPDLLVTVAKQMRKDVP